MPPDSLCWLGLLHVMLYPLGGGVHLSRPQMDGPCIRGADERTYRIAFTVRVCGEDCIRHSWSGAYPSLAQRRCSVRLAVLWIWFHRIEMETCFVWSWLSEWPRPSGAASWRNVFLLFYMIISRPIWKNFFLSCGEIDTFPENKTKPKPDITLELIKISINVILINYFSGEAWTEGGNGERITHSIRWTRISEL